MSDEIKIEKIIERQDYGFGKVYIYARIIERSSMRTLTHKFFGRKGWLFSRESAERVYQRAHEWADAQVELAVKYELPDKA